MAPFAAVTETNGVVKAMEVRCDVSQLDASRRDAEGRHRNRASVCKAFR